MSKGSMRRPTQVPRTQFAKNWDRVFRQHKDLELDEPEFDFKGKQDSTVEPEN